MDDPQIRDIYVVSCYIIMGLLAVVVCTWVGLEKRKGNEVEMVVPIMSIVAWFAAPLSFVFFIFAVTVFGLPFFLVHVLGSIAVVVSKVYCSVDPEIDKLLDYFGI